MPRGRRPAMPRVDAGGRGWRQERGRRAEERALAFLRARGLRCLARNWRRRRCELDLVMADGAALVFVEVRYRGRSDYGGAAASVDARKQRRLIRCALLYLQAYPPSGDVRFDVVSLAPAASDGAGDVAEPTVTWIRDAFRPVL